MKSIQSIAALGAALLLSSAASAATFVVDVTGARSVSSILDAGDNTVRTYQVAANAHIKAVRWNVTITAFDPSWLGEAALQITGRDPEGAGAVVIPGRGNDRSGTATFVGGFDLEANDLDFTLDDDGILRLEFFELYENFFLDPNAIWDSGTMTFDYDAGDVADPIPEPATWATMMLGFGLAGASLRRRGRMLRLV